MVMEDTLKSLQYISIKVFHQTEGFLMITYELGHEGNHEVEKTDGLDEGETQNGIREELATESRVAGNTVKESGEDKTDTDTGTSQTDGSGTHTQVLGDLDHGLSNLRGVGSAGSLLESILGGAVQDLGGLLALSGAERSSSACRSNRSARLFSTCFQGHWACNWPNKYCPEKYSRPIEWFSGLRDFSTYW
jgi:hypothetical protein